MTPAALTAHRKALKLSKVALAAALGISDDTIARYEAGTWPAPPWYALAIKGLALEKAH